MWVLSDDREIRSADVITVQIRRWRWDAAFCAQSTHTGVGQFHAAEHATHIDVS